MLSPASRPEKVKSPTYFILLDPLRFLAALLVMGLHLGLWGWWKDGDGIGTIARYFPAYPEFPELVSFTWFGWMGVQIFFVISGFVITVSAEQSTAKRFLRSRFLRIYPVAWICSTIALLTIIVTADHHGKVDVFLRYLNTMILSPYPFWIDGVYWTLALELVFYGLVLILLSLGKQNSLDRFGIFLGCTSSLYIVAMVTDLSPTGWIYTLLLLRHGVFFAIGILVWSLKDARHAIPWRILGLLAFFMAAGVLEILYTAVEKQNALNLTAPLYPPAVTWLLLVLGIFSCAICADWFNQRLKPLEGVLRVLGLATYPLYLIHQTLGGAVAELAFEAGLNRFVALLFAILSCITVSIVIALLVEPPVRRVAAGGFDTITRLLMASKTVNLRKG